MSGSFDWLPVPLMGLAVSGEVESWNRAAERDFRLTSAEIVGQSPPLAAESVDSLRKLLQRLQTGDVSEPITVRWGPQEIPVCLTVAVVPEGGVVAILSRLSHDPAQSEHEGDAARMIEEAVAYVEGQRERDRRFDELERRELQRTEELAAANLELSSFAYSVSHDLRQPLRAIDGFSQALLEDYGDALAPTAQDYLERIRRASQRMGDLIDGLLALSRITRSDLHEQDVDLTALAESVAADLHRFDAERGVSVDIQRGMRAWGDPRLLRVVLDNLIGNAWKYSARREDARITMTASDHAGETIYTVRDNGVGFDMRYADKLFGPFQRLHSPSEFEGNGIGLATVQRIVRRHGGRVWGEGTVGQGARFSFTLPVPRR